MNTEAEPIKKIMQDKLLTVKTVNSFNNNINNTVNCGIPIKEEYKDLDLKTDELLNELKGNPEYVAEKLSRELDDLHSKDYYLILAKNSDPGVLLEALSITQLAARENKIKYKKWAYFKAILQRWGKLPKFLK